MILVCIGGIAVFAYLFFGQKIVRGKKYFVLSTGIVLLLYAALRAQNLQPDIPDYVRKYEQYAKYSFQEIISIFKQENFKDPTYYFLGWLFSRLFSNAQVWLTFVAAVYIFTVALLIYKESEDPLISFIAFLALGFFEFSLSGLRQTLAMSFTMLSYFGIKRKKPILSIALVLLASLFHQSAILFLVAYPIARRKPGIVHLIVFFVSIVLFISSQDVIMDFLKKYLIDTQYSNYLEQDTALTISGFIIQIAIFVFCLVYYPAVSKKYEQATILYNLSFLGLLFQLFASMVAEIFRISMYFSFFNILLIPMAISVEKNKKVKSLETVGICMLFIAYMLLTGIPEYAFIWD